MRTTVDLNDELLQAARGKATERGISLTRFLEEALAAVLAPPSASNKRFRLRWKPHSGRFIGGIDIADRDALLEVMPERRVPRSTSKLVRPSQWKETRQPVAKRHPVRPPELMKAIQEHMIDGADTVILAECGNSFAWCNHHLRFSRPGGYRTSTLFGSMGHAAAGVVGAAIARKGKAVAVLGDGSMLMNSEISTAVQYEAPAVWIVLNDAGYGMCRDGHAVLGLADDQLDCPRVDFVAFARAVGADGVQVDSEDQLAAAMEQALATDRPFVVDVQIDPEPQSPLVKRFESLVKQGTGKSVSGWEK